MGFFGHDTGYILIFPPLLGTHNECLKLPIFPQLIPNLNGNWAVKLRLVGRLED